MDVVSLKTCVDVESFFFFFLVFIFLTQDATLFECRLASLDESLYYDLHGMRKRGPPLSYCQEAWAVATASDIVWFCRASSCVSAKPAIAMEEGDPSDGIDSDGVSSGWASRNDRSIARPG